MARISDTSPRRTARITGVLYLITILAGIYAQGFVSARLIVWGDAAATAANILTHRSLVELGFTVYMIEMACNVAITALFYDLLKPVNRTLSLAAAFLGLAGCIIKTFGRVFFLVPLFILGDTRVLSAFNIDQLRALALLSLKVNDQAAAMALAFFGFYTVLTGYLILKSTFLPRILGGLAMLAGLGWMTFLSPPLGYRLFPYIAVFALLVALALILWLIVFGVNEQRWKEQAGVADGA
jgi:hypothetical protein